jgi:hypothetical protein
MRNAYHLVYGKDVLAEIKISKQDLRLQCERELKGNLLKLRQAYVRSYGNKKQLKDLISQSVVAYVSIFRALLFLKNQPIPESRREVISSACRLFSFDASLFYWLISVKDRKIKPKNKDLVLKIPEYIDSVRRLSGEINRMEF